MDELSAHEPWAARHDELFGDEAVLARPAGRRLFAWTLLLALVLIAISLFWSACEAHYRNCLEATSVRTSGSNAPLDRLTRQTAVKNCSRSPFGG